MPLSPEAQELLRCYLDMRRDSNQDLWVSEKREPMGYHGIGRDIGRLFSKAGVETKDKFHVFRRTFAKHAVLQGVPRPYIRAIAGWRDAQMLDRYTAGMEEEDEALDAFRGFKPFGGG